MLKKIILSFLFLLNFTLYSTNIYVSPKGNDTSKGTEKKPYKTLKKAIEYAKFIRKQSKEKITIHLLEGDYHLSSTLVLSPEVNNLHIVGKGVNKVFIKGSKIIQPKWKSFNKNIWVTTIDKDLDFNQLFINGEAQILARYPNFDENGGAWQGHAADAFSKERIATWKNPIGGFVHGMHRGRWGGFHYQITGVDNKGELKLIGGHQNNRPSTMHKDLRMVENIFEELDSNKEWYLDTKNHKLYVWKNQNVNIKKAKIEVSVLKHLIEVKGTLQNPVKNITFSNINFQHASRTFMEPYHKLLRSDWTIYRGGAILLDATENCTINDCEFTNLGGNVIFANSYNRNINITGNHIYNCGASAISFVGDTTAVRSPSYEYREFVPLKDMDTVKGPKNELYPANCKVDNNLIYKIGRIEKQVAGVQISMAMKIHVSRNSIYDVPRSGINVSEGTWGGHIIEFNDVFNTVLETSDHGSFNSWGRDRFWHPTYQTMVAITTENPEMPFWDAIYPTIIRNNRFRCDHGWDIDLDDGSSNYEIYNNLCLNRGIKLREGFNRVVKNNIMVNNTLHAHVWFKNSNDIVTNNILMRSYADIRLLGWGKEIDANLFSSTAYLQYAQAKGVDTHSLAGNPLFVNPSIGDFSVQKNSPALKIGFKNFPMNQFGVQKPTLKRIAKEPIIPALKMNTTSKKGVKNMVWSGITLKNIENIEEQSSYGTHNQNGVIVLKIEENSKYFKSSLKVGDVIIAVNKDKIRYISGFVETYKKYEYLREIPLTVVRDQNEIKIEL